MAKCVKEGTLHVFATGAGNVQKWQQRFYVLNGFSSTTKARLDCYQDEMNFKRKQSPQKTICIDDIETIRNSEKSGHTPQHKYTFEIGCNVQKKVVLFSAQSYDDMDQWLMALMATKFESEQGKKEEAHSKTETLENVTFQNAIYDSVEEDVTYSVEVDDNEASRRCNLSQNKMYQLHIHLCNLSLADPETKSTIYEWPYKLIRRYGRSTSQFSFEAGRRCNSGAGLFNFKTEMADKLFSDVRNRTMAMRENQHDGDSGEIIVENHRKPSPVPVLRPADNTKPVAFSPTPPKPTTAKPVVVSPVLPKPATAKPVKVPVAPIAAPRPQPAGKPPVIKPEGGNVKDKVKSFQDSTDGIPISVQKLPLAGKLSGGKEKGDTRKTPHAPFVPSKSEQDKRMKDMSKIHKEMSGKTEKPKHHLKTAKDAGSSKMADVLLHTKKSDLPPPSKLPEANNGSHGLPLQMRSRSLPAPPPETEKHDPSYVQYDDVTYSPPNDSEYSETYAEISQGNCAVRPTDDSTDSYAYAAVAPAAFSDVKMSSVVAEMSRSRRPVPAAIPSPSDGAGDTYDYLDFAGVSNATTKDTEKQSENVYGHLSMVDTEDEAGYSDPITLKASPAQKGSKK